MSLRWTPEEYEAYQARHGKRSAPINHAGYVPLSGHSREIGGAHGCKADQGKEIDLQAKIERFLADRGYYFFHDRSRKENARGMPDLVIAMPEGRVLWLELKSAGGRLRPEQKMVRLKLLALGQEWYEVRSFRQFVDIVNGGGANRDVRQADRVG